MSTATRARYRADRWEQRVGSRHGVSVIRSGQRYALGLVFHDAA